MSKVSLVHVPSHVGIKDNDKADELAVKDAKLPENREDLHRGQIQNYIPIYDSVRYTRSEVYSIIKDRARKNLRSYTTLRAKQTWPEFKPGRARLSNRVMTKGIICTATSGADTSMTAGAS